MAPLSASLPRCFARRLLDGDIDAIEEVGHGDHENDGGQPLLVVVPDGFLPDLVRNRVGPVGKTGDGLGECEGGAFGVGEVGGFPPGRYSEEALVGFASLFGAARARINTEAAAIDLTRAQVDKLKCFPRHSALVDSLEQGLYAI